MLNYLIVLTFLPVAAGFLTLIGGRGASARKNAALVVFTIGLVASILSFISRPESLEMHLMDGFSLSAGYHVIAAFIMIFINLFGLLVAMYAGGYGEDKKEFYSYLLILIGFANLTVMASDLLLFAFGWGSMLVLLYAFLLPGSEASARKAVSVVGAADFMLILGIAIYATLARSTAIPSSGEGLPVETPLAFFAFILLFGGAIGKAGAWPFHPWIPDASTTASMPVMAILPASLDKLLGIYLLARVCTDLFTLNAGATGVILLVGGFTVMFAVMMALVQKDARKLLSYHAVSQVGYMVIGFGTGVPLGFAAGLFHMLNNAIYKTGLFLSAGAAGKEKGTFNIANMGGLAKFMPVTFVCALIFSLSISGVPIFSGFVSKWMVYQGGIQGLMEAGGPVLRVIFVVALLAAMFGSALTLASFVKFLHSVFLGQESDAGATAPKEAVRAMKYPLVVLAALCVILGVFPQLFLGHVIEPWMPEAAVLGGDWQALPAFILLALGLLIGAVVVFGWLARGKVRTSTAYFGGQAASEELNYPATEFYKSVQEMSPVAAFYRVMGWKVMDIYCVLTSVLKALGLGLYYIVDRGINLLTLGVGAAALGMSKAFGAAHTGNLDFYLVWCLLAMALLFFVIVW